MKSRYIEFDDRDHAYYVNGVSYPSVTAILEHCGLVSAHCKDGAAAHRGHEVHKWCAADAGIVQRVDMRRVPKQWRGYLHAYRQWRKDTGFLPAACEQIVTCDSARFAGRFDVVGVLPKLGETIVDIKTGKPPAYTHLQLAAYAFAFMPEKIFNRVALQLCADGRYFATPYSVESFGLNRAEWLVLVQKFHKEKNGTN